MFPFALVHRYVAVVLLDVREMAFVPRRGYRRTTGYDHVYG